MKTLDVWYCGWGQRWRLGTLAQGREQILFEYSGEALAQRLELSPFRLPLRPLAYGGFPDHQDQLPGLIADSLPDGWGRLLMDRLFNQARLNPAEASPLDRLAFIHDRAIGALVFEPAPPNDLTPADVELMEIARHTQLVLADKATDALVQLAIMGGSPHGAKPKVLVQYDPFKHTMSTHPEAAGSPWMVKFQGYGEHRESCAIEALYCDLARDAGLEVPTTRWFELDPKTSAFGIERFDREDGMRVPTLSFAALLDDDFRQPRRDYRELLRTIRALTRDEREVEKAFIRCVFNVIFHNRADHSRNFSFRMNQRYEWKLAPAYDLSYREGVDGRHRMGIMGEYESPGLEHLLALAKDAQLKESTARARIDQVADAAARFNRRAKDWPIRQLSIRQMSAAINRHLKRLG